jgi:DNA-binding MarR family transcriptional regulator
VSRQVAQLVRAGLVRSEPDPGDGRARRLALTAEGHLRCEQVVQARCHAIGRALQDWSDVQVAAFTDLFREFNGQVEKLAQMTEEPT